MLRVHKISYGGIRGIERNKILGTISLEWKRKRHELLLS